MSIINYQNLDKVEYFDLEEYIGNIKLSNYLLEHLQETNVKFDEYLRCLLSLNPDCVIQYLFCNLSEEIENSQAIENHYIKASDILNNDIYFEKFRISHKQIHDLHNFALQNEQLNPTFQYRDVPIRVSKMTFQGEYIFWYGAEAKDVKSFMDSFIKIYKKTSTSMLLSNPFLKSALMHLLFVRIHPYTDGNGRTARLIHNIKFTDSINKIYGMKLKICPLYLSQSIFMNKLTYADRLNSIYFDLKHDTNEAINKQFDFILNMVDEQIYYNFNKVYEKVVK